MYVNVKELGPVDVGPVRDMLNPSLYGILQSMYYSHIDYRTAMQAAGRVYGEGGCSPDELKRFEKAIKLEGLAP